MSGGNEKFVVTVVESSPQMPNTLWEFKVSLPPPLLNPNCPSELEPICPLSLLRPP